MKVILFLQGDERPLRPRTWNRPKPLLNVAGNTVLGHLLDLLEDVTTDEVIFIVGTRGEQIVDWIGLHYPHLDAHFVFQEESAGLVHAVSLCREFLEDDPAGVLLSDGDGLIEANYARLDESVAEKNAAAALFVQKEDEIGDFDSVLTDQAGFVHHLIQKPASSEGALTLVGLAYFREGGQLLQVTDDIMNNPPDTSAGTGLAAIYSRMMQQGLPMVTRPVYQWSDTSNHDNMLSTNIRLLSVGYHSADAIERSYAEEFLVIPPVYLHPQAQIQNAIIGPYASIGANVRIKDAIVRNCILDAGASIQGCLLEHTLVGENARVTGRAASLILGDDAGVDLH